MPDVVIPKEFRLRKKLIAVPERQYRALLTYQRELAEVHEAEADLAAGRYVVASSLDEALDKFRVGILEPNR